MRRWACPLDVDSGPREGFAGETFGERMRGGRRRVLPPEETCICKRRCLSSPAGLAAPQSLGSPDRTHAGRGEGARRQWRPSYINPGPAQSRTSCTPTETHTRGSGLDDLDSSSLSVKRADDPEPIGPTTHPFRIPVWAGTYSFGVRSAGLTSPAVARGCVSRRVMTGCSCIARTVGSASSARRCWRFECLRTGLARPGQGWSG